MEEVEGVWDEMLAKDIGESVVGLRCYYDNYKECNSIYPQVASQLIKNDFIKEYEEKREKNIHVVWGSYVPKVSKVKYLDNTIRVYERAREAYIFSWDDVPGKDSKRLTDFIWPDGLKNFKIEKNDVAKTITIIGTTAYGSDHQVILKLNEEQNEKLEHKADKIDIKQLIERSDEKFETLQKEMNTRSEALQKEMNARFEAINARFEAIEKRFATLQWMIGIGFTAIFLMITF